MNENKNNVETYNEESVKEKREEKDVISEENAVVEVSMLGEY